jgi:hypothetical protein
MSRRLSLKSLDRVVQTDSVLVGQIGDELVALDVDRGVCFGLNSVASHVWQGIAEPVTVRDLCRKLHEIYDVEYEICEAQITDLLQDLLEEGLARVA